MSVNLFVCLSRVCLKTDALRKSIPETVGGGGSFLKDQIPGLYVCGGGGGGQLGGWGWGGQIKLGSTN